jgi:hypothetical protein
MTVTVSWYDEQHTHILVEAVGVLTWEELFSASDQIVALLDTIKGKANIACDMRQMEKWPSIIFSAETRKLINAPYFSHPNSGKFIFIGVSPFQRAMFNILWKLYPQVAARCQFAENQAELDALLAQNTTP